LLDETDNAAFSDSNASNFLEADDIHQRDSYVSELDIANEDVSNILKQSISLQELTNSLSLNTESTGRDAMTVDENCLNIKITNVVSLPPEAFENTLSMTHEDALQSSANESPKENMLVSSTLSLKRSAHEGSFIKKKNNS